MLSLPLNAFADINSCGALTCSDRQTYFRLSEVVRPDVTFLKRKDDVRLYDPVRVCEEDMKTAGLESRSVSVTLCLGLTSTSVRLNVLECV